MRVRLLLLFSWGWISATQCVYAVNLDPAYVAVFFANPYPLSPSKALRSTMMTLWSETKVALASSDAVAIWQEHKQSVCLEKVLALHTLLDIIAMRGNSDEQDGAHLQSVLLEVEKNIYQLTQNIHTDDVACLKVIVDHVKKKMEQVFSTYSIGKKSGYVILLFKRSNTVVRTNHQLA